jgi:hypothetical protein
MLMRQNLFALVMFATCLPLGAAGQPLIQSQEGIALQNEILQLQNQMQRGRRVLAGRRRRAGAHGFRDRAAG